MGNQVSRSRALATLLAILSLAVFAACGGDDEGGGGDSGGGGGGDGGEPIQLGANLSLSGPAAAIGEPARNGLQLAVDLINEDGGIDGRQLELQILDDASDPERAASNARRLISDGVVAVFGASTGSNTTALSPVLLQSGVLHMSTTGPDVPGASDGPTLFYMAPSQELNVASAACWVDQTLGAQSVGMLHATDGYGEAGASFLPPMLEERGIELSTTESTDLDATDMSVQWTQIRESNPDAAVLWVSSGGSIVALRNADQLGVEAPIVGGLGMASQAVLDGAGEAAEGAVVGSFISPADPAPYQEEFVAAFEEAYPDAAPDFFSGESYDAVNLVAEVLSENPDATQEDGSELAAALEERTVRGVIAEYEFTPEDHVGPDLEDYVFIEARGGEWRVAEDQPECEA